MKSVEYNKNFLSEIIIKIQYQKISKENYYNCFEEFKKLMSNHFPILTEYKSKEFRFTSTNNEEPEVTSSLGLNSWLFRDNDKKLLTLSENELLLQYNGEFYESFKKSIYPILSLMLNGLKIFNVDNYNNIGIRYINQIQETELTLNEILAEEYSFNFNLKNSIRIMNKIEFFEDDLLIIFNFGEFNDNYPSNEIKHNFILDYDCILNQPLIFDNLKETILNMHEKIELFFDKTTSKEFKEELGEK